ncbi:MAG: GPR endopeptidase [Ruminococcaceae bacterium]|nr:GPR endopeptidase [Oscillospiraceae bacterium]
MILSQRTDLAEEAQALWQRSAGKTTTLPGVKAREWEENGVPRQRVEILDPEGAEALGKPQGCYDTLWTPPDSRPSDDLADALAGVISGQLRLRQDSRVLVVALGNEAMTPDAIGPMSARGLLVTRHLRAMMPELFGDLREVSVLIPGVLGMTGIESAGIVRSVVEDIRPDRVLVVDALAAGEGSRLCRVIQVTDAGIVPGSGVGNSRQPLSQKTLGVPVVAVGAATVMDAGTTDEPLLVTHRDVDERVKRLSSLISAGINRALFDGMTKGEIAQFVGIWGT